MGGFGSGRREYVTTATVDEYPEMDTDDLTGLTEHPSATGRIYWGDSEDVDANYLAWRAEII